MYELIFFFLLFALPLGALYCNNRKKTCQDDQKKAFWQDFCIGLSILSFIYIFFVAFVACCAFLSFTFGGVVDHM